MRRGVPLAPLTTLELGGPARYLAEVRDEAEIRAALEFARERGLAVRVLGGGSNLVVADAGVDALVLHMKGRGIVARPSDDAVRLEVQAGEPWDEVVRFAVARGLAGVECLSGIPGSAGATPIQNVGAYGQEVGEALEEVRVLDRERLEVVCLGRERCELGYRDSLFKRNPDRFLVLSMTLILRPGGPPALRYPELARAVGASPSLTQVREAVLALRRSKSMVLDPADPNRRSAGSFFTNPILPEGDAARVIAKAIDEGLATSPEGVPHYPAGPGRTKLAAGWLIERAGIRKGMRRGAVGVSSRHALGLVHHGGGSTAELLALADSIREAVAARFGVRLEREPVLWDDRG